MTGFEKALVINDLHIPFHDPHAVELSLQVAEASKVDRIFINGDLQDCWEISHFVKNPSLHSAANLNAELRQGRTFLKNLRARFGKAKITLIGGNHEYRFMVFISKNARELTGLAGLTIWEQLGCAESGVEVIDSGLKESSYLWGKLLIGHFDAVNKHSAYTAKNLLENKGISGIQAHTHRLGSYFKRVYDRDMVFYENGCLCDRSPVYIDRPNWQLGFSIVYKDRKSDFFYVEQKPITETVTGGKRLYRVFHDGVCFQRSTAIAERKAA